MHHASYLLFALSLLPAIILLFSAILDKKHSLLSPFWSILFPVVVGTSLKIVLYQTAKSSESLAKAFTGLSINDIAVSLLMISVFFLVTSITYFTVNFGSNHKSSVNRLGTISVELNRPLLLLVTLAVLTCSLISLHFLLKASGGGFDSIAEFSGKRRIVESSGAVSSGGVYRVFTNFAKVNTLLLFALWLRCPSIRRDIILWSGLLLGIFVTAINSAALSERTSFALLLIPLLGGLKTQDVITGFHISIVFACALVFANTIVILRSASESDGLTISGLLSNSNEIPLRLTESINGTDVTKVTRIRQHCDAFSDFFYGRTLVTWPTNLIPKLVWPNKPDVSLDRWVTRVVYGGTPEVDMAPLPPSLVGECYMNGGWIGIFLGAFAYGAGLKCLIEKLFPGSNSSVFSVFCFFSTLPLLTHLINMADFGSSMFRLCIDLGSGLFLIQIYSRLAWRTHQYPQFTILVDEASGGFS